MLFNNELATGEWGPKHPKFYQLCLGRLFAPLKHSINWDMRCKATISCRGAPFPNLTPLLF